MHMTVTEFIKEYQLSYAVVRVDKRTDGLMGYPLQRHWRYTFRTLRNDNKFAGYFSQGSAHTEAPTAEEVLEMCGVDARTFMENEDALLMAYEFGYDLDDPAEYKRAHRVYEACGESHEELTEMLGADGLEALWECSALDE